MFIFATKATSNSLFDAGHLLISFYPRSENTTVVRYKIPTRGLLGLRNAILTASRGTAILNTIFDGYEPWAGEISTRDQGSLVRFDSWFLGYCIDALDIGYSFSVKILNELLNSITMF